MKRQIQMCDVLSYKVCVLQRPLLFCLMVCEHSHLIIFDFFDIYVNKRGRRLELD